MRPKQKTYFCIGKQLFNGNAVIFAADAEGETVNFPSSLAEHWRTCPEFEWFASATEAEAAIVAGRVNRPQTTINNLGTEHIIWSWNEASNSESEQ